MPQLKENIKAQKQFYRSENLKAVNSHRSLKKHRSNIFIFVYRGQSQTPNVFGTHLHKGRSGSDFQQCNLQSRRKMLRT